MIRINNKEFNDISFDDIKWVLENYEESFFIELKDDKTEPKKFLKEVSAFSNTFGGYIFIGISDDKEIIGCKNWSEERITTVIKDGITPNPIYSVRTVYNDDIKIIVVMINEGPIPPYITNSGLIYERLSSTSAPIKDSSKLALLYNKSKDNKLEIDNKLHIDKIDKIKVNGLCGYIDGGFSLTSIDEEIIRKALNQFDFKKVKELETRNEHIISKVGQSFYVTFGTVEGEWITPGFENFIEIMSDGSVRYRILILEGKEAGTANIAILFLVSEFFKNLYYSIFGEIICENFIDAKWYEELTVLKAFVPVLESSDKSGDYNRIWREWLYSQTKLYGQLQVFVGTRTPKNGYYLIDKKEIENIYEEVTSSTIIEHLFFSTLSLLGYWDTESFRKCSEELSKLQTDKTN